MGRRPLDLGATFASSAMMLFAGQVQSQELRYSEQKCEENVTCNALFNEKPDYQVEGEVIEVIDADTLKIKLHVLPGLEYVVSVRSRGVDAPEIFRPSCPEENELGQKAKASIARKFEPGRWVLVSDIQNDKYGGRILGKIERWASDRMKSVSEELLESNLAVPDPDGSSQYNWCEGTVK